MGVTRTEAFQEVDQVLHSGMFGIAPVQTARINVMSLSSVPCSVEMRFFDAQNQVLAQSRVDLMHGESAFLDLSYPELGRQGRVPIRAEVVGQPPPDPDRPPTSLA